MRVEARLKIFGVLLGLILGATGCGEDEATAAGPATQPGREPVEVSLADLTTGSLPRTIDVVGTLYGDEEIDLSSKVAGRVLEVLADVGDRVAPGAALARIDPVDFELVVRQREMALLEALAGLGLEELPGDDFDVSQVATVDRARFQAANAKARMERARQLYSQQPPLISEQEFTDLETAYQVSERNYDVAVLEARQQIAVARARESELATARQRLADTVLRAPGDRSATTQPSGPPRFVVSRRLVSVGEYVSEGTAMYRVVADNPIKHKVAVPERFAGQVKTGQPTKLQVEGSDARFSGTVSRINPAVDVGSRTFEVEILVPNAGHELKPGSFGRGAIEVGEQADVILIPRDALVSFAGTDKVFSVKDNKAVEHPVTLLRRDGDLLPIREKLAVDQVVVQGAGRLANDLPVRVIDPPDAE